jgi:HK97 family phage major capsid protein
MSGTRPNLIDGFRYVVDNQIPNNIGGANQTVIFFGDLSYWLQGNGGQEIGMSEHVGFKENLNWYKVVGYADGFYAITEAMAYLEAVPTV